MDQSGKLRQQMGNAESDNYGYEYREVIKSMHWMLRLTFDGEPWVWLARHVRSTGRDSYTHWL